VRAGPQSLKRRVHQSVYRQNAEPRLYSWTPAMTDAVARLSAALAARYRIEREPGAGGVATVCLVEDLTHDRKVAIKA